MDAREKLINRLHKGQTQPPTWTPSPVKGVSEDPKVTEARRKLADRLHRAGKG